MELRLPLSILTTPSPLQGVDASLAAMAPCARLYGFLGCQLSSTYGVSGPYADWIQTYSSDEYLVGVGKGESGRRGGLTPTRPNSNPGSTLPLLRCQPGSPYAQGEAVGWDGGADGIR